LRFEQLSCAFKNLYEEINEMRENAKSSFENLFKIATESAEKIGVQLVVLKIRENYAGHSEVYYRKPIFIPFLNHYLDQLSSRFLDYGKLFLKIQNIMPSKCITLDTDEIKETEHILKTE